MNYESTSVAQLRSLHWHFGRWSGRRRRSVWRTNSLILFERRGRRSIRPLKTGLSRPCASISTLVLICNVRDPLTGQTYSRDARYVAQKAEAYLKSAGVGDAAYFGPEAEFFVFNEVRYGQGINYAMHEIDSK